MGSSPPLPIIEVFYSSFFKGKDELILMTGSGIKNKKVASSLLDGIILAKDLKLYSSLTTSRIQSWQDQLLYEVKLYSCANFNYLFRCIITNYFSLHQMNMSLWTVSARLHKLVEYWVYHDH